MKPVDLKVERSGDTFRVLSPLVGLWISAVREGQLVNDRCEVGAFDVLGRRQRVALDGGVAGRVVRVEGANVRARPVGWGDLLFEVDSTLGAPILATAASAGTSAAETHDVFRAPSSGRFYSRPEPSKPPFVEPGTIITRGQPVCMLEVMKTYSRVRYDGERARVIAVRPADQDDLEEGAIILELEPAPS